MESSGQDDRARLKEVLNALENEHARTAFAARADVPAIDSNRPTVRLLNNRRQPAMSGRNIHSARAELNLVEILDEFGASWWVTAARYDQIVASGAASLTRQFAIIRPTAQERAWIRLADAARQLQQFVGELDEADAKTRVWRAKESGKFTASGERRNLRIEPTSFDAWCMQQQREYLDSLN